MFHREEKVQSNMWQSLLAYQPFEAPLFLDIETTGLGWRSTHLYLIGLLFKQNGQWILRQFFLDHPFEEEDFLQSISNFLATLSFDGIIHYNGDTFDLPYLRQKYAYYHLPLPVCFSSAAPGLDLLREIRSCKSLLQLSSLRQKEVETWLGLSREDRFTGGELISYYQRYLQEPSTGLLSLLYLHNQEDLLSMPSLLPMLAYTQINKGDYSIEHIAWEKPQKDIVNLCVQITVPHSFPKPTQSTAGPLHIRCADGLAHITVRAFQGTLKYFFDDYQNYYYLPEEDMAVHKSIGSVVQSDHREQAKASTCYQKKEGLFLPQTRPAEKPVFYQSYRSKPAFFLADEAWLLDLTAVKSYLQSFF